MIEGCYSQGPWQAEEMNWHEMGFQQRHLWGPTSGAERPCAAEKVGKWMNRKQLCRKRPRDPCRLVEHGSTVWPCGEEGHHILGCTGKTVAKWREVIIPFYWAFVRPHLKRRVQIAPQYKENIDILEEGQRKAVKTIRILENKMYKERLIKLGLFSFRREGCQEILLLSTSTQCGSTKDQTLLGCSWR